MVRLTCEVTRLASSASAVTKVMAPTRSRYSENDLENELEITQGSPTRVKAWTAWASSSMPSPKPWYAKSMNGTRSRARTSSTTSSHWAGLKSTPVGLWEQA